jgi:hypothetical protein
LVRSEAAEGVVYFLEKPSSLEDGVVGTRITEEVDGLGEA